METLRQFFIFIGLLTDQNTDQMNIVFDHAIDVANQELGLSLSSLKADVNYGDAFHSYRNLCRMLEVIFRIEWIKKKIN